MTTAKAKGLHAKLAEVMAEAERIPKNGKAPAAMGGFPFVQVGDAADFIRKALGTRGVSMLPTAVEIVGQKEHATSKGGTMTTVELRVTWTVTDGETGESAVLQSYGVGADTGDKYSGKAMTNAMKYALLAGFQLSTGDDVETHDTSDRQSAPADAGGERMDLIGIDTLSGTIGKGGSDRYQCEWRESPQGPVIGFAVKGSEKSYPQVGVMGDIAATLHASGEELLGKHVRLRGRFYNVRQAGRTSYVRVIVGQGEGDFIETPDVRIPPDTSDEAPAAQEATETPVEAPSLPMLLDEEERALVGGGLPA